MIYFTGDTHGDFIRFSTDRFPEGRNCTKEDYVIILGDFGGVWKLKEDSAERYWLNWLDSKPWTTLFIDGNHENHARLDAMPVEEWHGGKTHRLRPSIIHLMRGQVFDIGGYCMFAFGGACSHDIFGGILDPSAPEGTLPGTTSELVLDAKYEFKVPLISFPQTSAGRRALNRKCRVMNSNRECFRVRGVSWWDRELPSEEEMKEGFENLSRKGNKVDYILSHTPDTQTLRILNESRMDRLTDYLLQIKQSVKCEKHLCGHVHINKVLQECKTECLYEKILQLR